MPSGRSARAWSWWRPRNDISLTLRQLDVADRLGDQSQIALALSRLSVDQLRAGGRLLGFLAMEKAVEVARDAHDLVNEAHTLANWSSNLNGDDARRALTVAHEAVEVAIRCGNLEWISLAQANRALARWVVGEWDEVVAAPAQETIHAEDESFVGTLAGLVLAARGQDPSEVTLAAAHRSHSGCWWMLGQVITQAFAGDPEASAAALAAHDAAYDENGLTDDYPTIFGAVMEIGLTYGDSDLLQRLAQVVDDAGALASTGLRGHRAFLGAVTATPEEAAERVEALFASALHEYDAWGSPVYTARAQAAYGAWLSRHGRIAEAEPLLTQARTTYAALGAVAWLEDLDQALAAHRVGS